MAFYRSHRWCVAGELLWSLPESGLFPVLVQRGLVVAHLLCLQKESCTCNTMLGSPINCRIWSSRIRLLWASDAGHSGSSPPLDDDSGFSGVELAFKDSLGSLHHTDYCSSTSNGRALPLPWTFRPCCLEIWLGPSGTIHESHHPWALGGAVHSWPASLVLQPFSLGFCGSETTVAAPFSCAAGPRRWAPLDPSPSYTWCLRPVLERA